MVNLTFKIITATILGTLVFFYFDSTYPIVDKADKVWQERGYIGVCLQVHKSCLQ